MNFATALSRAPKSTELLARLPQGFLLVYYSNDKLIFNGPTHQVEITPCFKGVSTRVIGPLPEGKPIAKEFQTLMKSEVQSPKDIKLQHARVALQLIKEACEAGR